jgi:hypothetical protein
MDGELTCPIPAGLGTRHAASVTALAQDALTCSSMSSEGQDGADSRRCT